MADVKKCPFCGDEASLYRSYGKYGYFVYMKCDLCSAETKGFKIYGNADDWEVSEAAQKAVFAWNRRSGENGHQTNC